MIDPAVKIEGLGKKFGRKWAVRDLSLEVPRGAVFGLLGPNGAGKSTTIHMLMGMLPPNEGSMTVLGLNPTKQDVAVRRRVGYVAEVHGFYEWMKVDELINFVAAYHKDWDWEKSSALKEEFGLDGKTKVKALSKGMRAKLALLLALSFNPEMLVLDEPTGGLDPAARRSFIESILERFHEEGKTILVSSHLMNEFSGLLDHVAFLKESELHLACPMEELIKKTKRAHLVFEEGVPDNLEIPGATAVRSNGREMVATLSGFDPERSPEEMRKTGASSVTFEDMTLEDIFVDLVTKS